MLKTLEDILWGGGENEDPNGGGSENEGGIAPASIPVNCMTMCCTTYCGTPPSSYSGNSCA